MELLKQFLHFVMHLDESLPDFISQHGIWIYGLLFLIIFCETGLVVTPFLPGDSLLFAVGAVAANDAFTNSLRLEYVIPLMIVAGVLGDAVNYAIGRKLGPAVFSRENGRLLRKDYLIKAQHFYDKHGGKAIILARFVPIVRTFAPFVAGIGRMKYSSFAYYNILGAIIWVVSLTLAGFFLGTIPIIKKNFEATIILIIIVSLLPIAFEWWKARKEAAATAAAASDAEPAA
ncbi:DedA family protein [Verrucomicrobium sp. BvORR034]|jgi:membrane-associated protein|uniref:DedA family protein n=1 Tax=Verrucomicrobium sp. BvORR034 TaxID=1396418 RepID=UPI0006790F22|nr:DedA family protein [Verrucomicrobium sp. BvORR034]